jgi:hypothetical protein
MNKRMQTLEKKGGSDGDRCEGFLENPSSLEKFFSRFITNFNIGFPFKGFKKFNAKEFEGGKDLLHMQ